MNTLKVAVTLKKTIGACLALGIGYVVTGYYLVPWWIEHNLPALLEKEIAHSVTIADVNFDPFTLMLSVKNFSIQQTNATPLLQCDRIALTFNLKASLLSKDWVIEHLAIDHPALLVIQQKNGTLNLSALNPTSPTESLDAAAKSPAILIKKITLTNGQLTWHNLTQTDPIKKDFHDLNATLENIHTLLPTPAPFHLHAQLLAAGEIQLEGELLLSQKALDGTFIAKDIDLQKSTDLPLTGIANLSAHFQLKFDRSPITVSIQNAILDLAHFSYDNQVNLNQLSLKNGRYDSQLQTLTLETLALEDIALRQGQAHLTLPSLIIDQFDVNLLHKKLHIAKGQLQDLELLDSSLTQLFTLPRLTLQALMLDVAEKKVAIDNIDAHQATIKTWLNPNGEFNYQTLLPEDATHVEDSHTLKTSDAYWGVSIGSLALNAFQGSFEDRTLEKPLVITVNPLTLKTGPIHTTDNNPTLFELDTTLNHEGKLRLQGTASLNPLKTHSQIVLNDLGLHAFQPYIDKFAHLDVIKGIFNLEGSLDIGKGEHGELNVQFKGNTGISHLLTRDQLQNKDLLKWDNLTLKNVEADMLAQRFSASTLLIEKPYTRIIIDKDKKFNFANLLVNSQSKTQSQSPSNTHQSATLPMPSVHFTLGNVQISNGSSSFSDLSMILPFSAEIKGLEGGATGISSEQQATIKLSLKGNAYDLSPVDVKGNIKPYLGDYHAALKFKGMPLPLVSPYMAEFFGYKVEKGKMTLGMDYNISQGELTASNNMLIEQFELGEKVKSPHANDAPLDLAVALLKDMNGIIKLDVPVVGTLNDPHFDLSSVIGDALINVMTNVITSPFQAIAKLLGTDENLSTIEFAAGQSELTTWQQQKLDGLATVLRQRDVLKLEIKGTAFENQDWPVLREIALEDYFKALKAEEMNRQTTQKTRAEYIDLTDDDKQRFIVDEFTTKFPHLIKQTLLGHIELVETEPGDFYTVARKKLAERLPVDPKRLNKLAASRARAIAKYIVQQGNIPNERVFILDTTLNPSRENDEINALLFIK